MKICKIQNVSFGRCCAKETTQTGKEADAERVVTDLGTAPSDKVIKNDTEKTIEHRMQEIREVQDLAISLDKASEAEIKAHGFYVRENTPEQRLFNYSSVKYFRDTPFEDTNDNIAARTAKSHSEIAIGHIKDLSTASAISHVSVPGRGIRRNILIFPKIDEENKTVEDGIFVKGLVFDDKYDFTAEDITIFDGEHKPKALIKGYAAGLRPASNFDYKKADAIYVIKDNKAELLPKGDEYYEILGKCPNSNTLHLLRK